jgi:hypothetical protein
MGRIKSFGEFRKKLDEAEASTAGEFIQQATNQAYSPTSSSSKSTNSGGTQKKRTIFGKGKISGLDLLMATKVGRGLEDWLLANTDIETGNVSDSPQTSDEIASYIRGNRSERERVERNVEIARSNDNSFEAIEPNASLLPPSSPYTYRGINSLTWNKVKGFLESSGEWNKIDKDKYTLVALRNKLSQKKRSHNHFIDALVLMSPESDNKVWAFKATTVPGPMFMVQQFRNWYMTHGKKDIINPKGLAIVQPGVYDYKIGKHNGYPAFVQNGNITVDRYEPVNGPGEIDFKTFSPGNTETGKFGINIHRASSRGTSRNVNTYSAGCIVFANSGDLKEVIDKLKSEGQRSIKLAVVQLDDV